MTHPRGCSCPHDAFPDVVVFGRRSTPRDGRNLLNGVGCPTVALMPFKLSLPSVQVPERRGRSPTIFPLRMSRGIRRGRSLRRRSSRRSRRLSSRQLPRSRVSLPASLENRRISTSCVRVASPSRVTTSRASTRQASVAPSLALSSGGVSISTSSCKSLNSRRMLCRRRVPTNSPGSRGSFATRGRARQPRPCSTSVALGRQPAPMVRSMLMIASRAEPPRTTSVTPGERRPKNRCRNGRRRSGRPGHPLPARARAMARFAAVVDLPSLWSALVTMTRAPRCCRAVRSRCSSAACETTRPPHPVVAPRSRAGSLSGASSGGTGMRPRSVSPSASPSPRCSGRACRGLQPRTQATTSSSPSTSP